MEGVIRVQGGMDPNWSSLGQQNKISGGEMDLSLG